MSDEITLQEILEVQAHFGLPSPALVEKDWYVVKALAAIMAADIAPFRLVFGGGTALGRAHKLIRRMSEDIDLKIISDREPTQPELRTIREAMTKALLMAGFEFDPTNSAHRTSSNKTRYTLYQLPYKPLTAGAGALRPEIKIEAAVWPLRLPAVVLPVSSFISEAHGRSPEVPNVACVSIAQTAAEKFVALTRRVAAERDLSEQERDPTLIRHVYDLHVTREHYDAAEVAALAREIIPHDVEVYGHKDPLYRADPIAETRRAIEVLTTDLGYAKQYEEFRRVMVYGDQIAFVACLDTLRNLAEHLKGDNQKHSRAGRGS